MRKQYHFRPGGSGALDAWDVDQLIALVESQPVEELLLADVAELDSDYWYSPDDLATVRSIAAHVMLMNEADLSYPVVLDPEGGVMDGMHRIARALVEGRGSVLARRLPVMPAPDFTDCHPDELRY